MNPLTKVVADPTSATGVTREPYTLKIGSKESVDRTLAQSALQTYLDQVNHYDKLVQQLTNILTSHIVGKQEQEEGEEEEQPPRSGQSDRPGTSKSRTSASAKPPRAPPSTWGFGELGKELLPALKGIGAIESPRETGNTQTYGGVRSKRISLAAQSATYRFGKNIKRGRKYNRAYSGFVGLLDPRPGSKSPPKSPAAASRSMSALGLGLGSDLLPTNQSQVSDWGLEDDDPLASTGQTQGSALTQDLMLFNLDSRREQEDQEKSRREAVAADRLEKLLARKNRRKEKRDRMAEYDKEHSGPRDGNRIGIIPWALLDDLDGEKMKFENEKKYAEFKSKVYGMG